jgi:hypothetical protein
MTKITHDFYLTKRKRTIKGLLPLIVLFLMGIQMSWGQPQKQVIGQFPFMDGGMEGQIATVGATGMRSNSAPAIAFNTWTVTSTSFNPRMIINDNTNARSGNMYIYGAGASTQTLATPPAPTTTEGLQPSTSYTVQFFYKAAPAALPSTDNAKMTVFVNSTNVLASGTESTIVTYATTGPNYVWTKAYATVSTNAIAVAANSYAGVRPRGASTGAFTASFDDFVVYAGAVDNTAPVAPTLPQVSGLAVSWAASSDVDGGGYMVVRYATNPNVDNDPNVNGIYAVGNTITNGTGSLVGTVVYVGTATSFNDAVAGSVSGSDYYKIYTVDKAFNYSNEIIAGPVAAPTSTTWTSGWSDGNPSATVEAIIEGTYSGVAFNAKKVTVNSGSLTITSGTMTVQNEVINNAGANGIVFENNANLIQVNNVTNTGNVVVKRTGSPLYRFDYTLWSSPVVSQNLVAFSPLTSQSPSRFYTYNTTFTDLVVLPNITNGAYSVIATPTGTNFTAGAGYLIRMPNTDPLSGYDAGTATLSYPGVFTGVPNNGDVPFTMVDGGAGLRYNLVGNPYPSPITMAQFVTDNANITGTLYFWRKTNGSGSAYCTWVGGVFASNGNTQSVNPAGIIQTGQGFFVEANGSGTALTFKNGQRVANTTGQFFKTKQETETTRIWLNATNPLGDFSQMAVSYVADGTQGVDAFDGKYINDSTFALTSNINNEEYTIQGRPAFDASDVVALNFKTAVAGDYTIAIDHADGLLASAQDVYLVDSKTGTETNLKSNAYTFTAVSGVDNARFSLKYQKTLKVNASVLNDNNVTVYKNNGVIYVNSGVSAINNIKVYDIQGRLIAEQNNVKATTASIHNLKATHQVLIVQVTSEDNKTVSKKVEN